MNGLMAGEKNDQWALSGSEAEVLNVGKVAVDPRLAADVWAVERLSSEAALTPGIFRSVLGRLWGAHNQVEIREVDPNLFLFGFVNTRERNFAVDGGPSYVNRFVVVMARFNITQYLPRFLWLRSPSGFASSISG